MARRCQFHEPQYTCLDCESVGAGFMRVVRWFLALVVGFVGGGIVLLVLGLLLAAWLQS